MKFLKKDKRPLIPDDIEVQKNDSQEYQKEKLYTAKIKGITKEKESYVYKIIESGEIYLSDLVFIEGKSQVYFTQKELEELKYWNNPNFEIEEVEE